jgi:hypothetical protein
MRFLFLTLRGTLTFLAQRVQEEGYEVELCHLVGPTTLKLPGQGFVDKVSVLNAPSQEETLIRLKEKLSPDTLIVFDFYGLGKLADKLRGEGYLVLGASSFHDAMYLNPSFQESLLKVSGVKVFSDEHKDLEVSIEGWFNGKEWIHHSLGSYIEERRFLTGGLGQEVECMGSTAWYWRHARPKIFKNTLYKLTSMLKNIHFVGPISMDTRGGECESIYPGFRAESTQALLTHLSDLGPTLYDCAKGAIRQFRPEYLFSTSLRLSLPPYPYAQGLEQLNGQLVKAEGVRFLPNDVWRGDEIKVVGYSGVIGSLVSVSETVASLEPKLYMDVKKVQAVDLQYRMDIISRRARRAVPILLKEVV